jgi:PAS domain S-box-containing protein
MANPEAGAATAAPPARAETAGRDAGFWRAVFEHTLEPAFIIDDHWRLVDANRAACELLGAPLDRIAGAPVSDFLSPADIAGSSDAAERWTSFLREGCTAGDCVIQRPDGAKGYASFRAQANFQPGFHLCFAEGGADRKTRVEAIRCAEALYNSLVQTTHTGYLVADPDGRVLDANPEYVRLAGHPDLDSIRGRDVLEWTVPEDRDRHAAGIATCLREGAVRDLTVHFTSAAGEIIPVEINATAVHADGEVRLLSLCRDITSRESARREIEKAWHELESRVQQRTAQLAQANDQIRIRAQQQEALAEFGRRALAGENVDALLHEVGAMVTRLLEVEYLVVLEHADPQSEQLLLRACHGWEGALGEPVATTNPAMLAGYVIHSGASVVFDDLNHETRFSASPLLIRWGVVSGIVVLIPGELRPFGVIGAHTIRARKFTQDDLHFMESVANVLAAAVERTRAEEIVRLAREAAVKANDAKLQFLSRMSHELRTPLNAILGFGQLLEIEELGGRQQESVDQIIGAGRHLLHLVNEVLDISRIESGVFTFAYEPLAVADLLTEAIDLMRPLAGAMEPPVPILVTTPEGNPHVLADHQRVRQVLLNLLSNAVKYNRPGGSVSVSALPAPDGRSMRLRVVDTGVGIPAEVLPRLFTPFDRLGAEKTSVEGSGIGLSLSKRMIEAQGGRLGVQSAEGKGSAFWIDLPVAAKPAESPRVLPEVPAPAQPAHDGSSAGKEALPQRTILHIEDNEQNRRLMEILISQRPRLRLVTASRGDEGLELARIHHPDLILLDIHLPGTSGDQVLHALRADAATKATPVVVVSADATAIRQSSARALGADNYLTKPFNVKEFLCIIDEYVGRDKAEVAAS